MSIFSKGVREVVKHYKSETHLRKDQCWRFEHLGKKDKITGVIKHYVRAKDGHILTALELEKEKPLFETATLVDIGPKYPFQEEYLERLGGSTTPAGVPLGTQISLLWLQSPYLIGQFHGAGYFLFRPIFAVSVCVAGWKVSLRPAVKMSTWNLSNNSDTLTLL